jgi:hypothetical protein
MTAFGSLHKGKTFFLLILFLAFAAFTTDILDLREELHLLYHTSSSNLDNNITTGIQSGFSFESNLIQQFCTLNQKSFIPISFLHLLPYGYRGPPTES